MTVTDPEGIRRLGLIAVLRGYVCDCLVKNSWEQSFNLARYGAYFSQPVNQGKCEECGGKKAGITRKVPFP